MLLCSIPGSVLSSVWGKKRLIGSSAWFKVHKWEWFLPAVTHTWAGGPVINTAQVLGLHDSSPTQALQPHQPSHHDLQPEANVCTQHSILGLAGGSLKLGLIVLGWVGAHHLGWSWPTTTTLFSVPHLLQTCFSSPYLQAFSDHLGWYYYFLLHSHIPIWLWFR